MIRILLITNLHLESFFFLFSFLGGQGSFFFIFYLFIFFWGGGKPLYLFKACAFDTHDVFVAFFQFVCFCV